MWVIGYFVTPTLFAALADRQLAGMLAGKLFILMGWVGMGCAVYMLLFMLFSMGWAVFKRWRFWAVFVMLLLTQIALFGIQPLMVQLKAEAFPRDLMESLLHDRFAMWHGIASVLYLAQSLLGFALVLGAGRNVK
jgi:hypothetical protein